MNHGYEPQVTPVPKGLTIYGGADNIILYDSCIIQVSGGIEESQRRAPNCLWEAREDFQEEAMYQPTMKG